MLFSGLPLLLLAADAVVLCRCWFCFALLRFRVLSFIVSRQLSFIQCNVCLARWYHIPQFYFRIFSLFFTNKTCFAYRMWKKLKCGIQPNQIDSYVMVLFVRLLFVVVVVNVLILLTFDEKNQQPIVLNLFRCFYEKWQHVHNRYYSPATLISVCTISIFPHFDAKTQVCYHDEF